MTVVRLLMPGDSATRYGRGAKLVIWLTKRKRRIASRAAESTSAMQARVS